MSENYKQDCRLPCSGVLNHKLEKLLLHDAQPHLSSLTPSQARRIIKDVVTGSLAFPNQVRSIDDIFIPGSKGEIPIRIYIPNVKTSTLLPVFVYFHGGGWVIFDLDTHENVCRSLANSVPCIVISVHYKQSPEYKFPSAVYDSYESVAWVAENAQSFGGDPSLIAVGGDSAGGNLATVTAIMARDKGWPNLKFQMLVYPVTNLSSFDTISYRLYQDGYLLTKSDMEWYKDNYLRNDEDGHNPHASPLLLSNFGGLPSTLIITAEFDVLRTEGERYAEMLRQSGVKVKCLCYNGMTHGFWLMDGVLDQARDAVNEAAKGFREAITGSFI